MLPSVQEINGKIEVMPDRFQILKSKQFDGMYAIIDSEEQTMVATADCIREAKQIKHDIERMVFQDRAVDEAMKNLGLYKWNALH